MTGPDAAARFDAAAAETAALLGLLLGERTEDPTVTDRLAVQVDVCLDLLDSGPRPRAFRTLHNLGVASRQLAIRGRTEYADKALHLLSQAVEIAYEEAPRTGGLDDLLSTLTTYLRATLWWRPDDTKIDRVEEMLEFASRSADPGLRSRLFGGWTALGAAFVVQAGNGTTLPNRERLTRAASAIRRAGSVHDEVDVDEVGSAESLGLYLALEPLLAACLATSAREAEAALDRLVSGMARIDAAYLADGFPGDTWRAVVLHHVSGTYQEAREVICRFALALLTADGAVKRLERRLNEHALPIGPTLDALEEADWVKTAWIHVARCVSALTRAYSNEDIDKSLRGGGSMAIADGLITLCATVSRVAGIPPSVVYLVVRLNAAVSPQQTPRSRRRILAPVTGRMIRIRRDLTKFSRHAKDAAATLLNHLDRHRGTAWLAARIDHGTGELRLRRLYQLGKTGTGAEFMDATLRTLATLPTGQSQIRGCLYLLAACTVRELPASAEQRQHLIGIATNALDRAHPDKTDPDTRRVLLQMLFGTGTAVPSRVWRREYLRCVEDARHDKRAIGDLAVLFYGTMAGKEAPDVGLGTAFEIMAHAESIGQHLTLLNAEIHLLQVMLVTELPDTSPEVRRRLGEAWKSVRSESIEGFGELSRVWTLLACLADSRLATVLELSESEVHNESLNALAAAFRLRRYSPPLTGKVFGNLFRTSHGLRNDPERMARTVRDWLDLFRESADHAMWLDLALRYCSYFRNEDDPAVTTLDERDHLLRQILESLMPAPGKSPSREFIMAAFLRCEHFSAMGHVHLTLRMYDQVLAMLPGGAALEPEWRWQIGYNHTRAKILAAALDGDVVGALSEFRRLRRLEDAPSSSSRWVIDALAADAAILDTLLSMVAGKHLADEVADLTAHAVRTIPEGPSMLGARSCVALARVLVEYAKSHADTPDDVARLLSACVTRAAMATNDPLVARKLREIRLDAAVAVDDLNAVATTFLSVLAHNDLRMLTSASVDELLSGRSFGLTLLRAVTQVAARGQLILAATLLDQMPCRAVRLAVAGQTSDQEGFAWDEATWQSLLGTMTPEPSRRAVTGVVVRFWVLDGRLYLLADSRTGRFDLVAVDGFTDVAARTIETMVDAEVQRLVVLPDLSSEHHHIKFRTCLQDLGTSASLGADPRFVTVDFSGRDWAVTVVHDMLRRYGGNRPAGRVTVVSRPGLQPEPDTSPAWSPGRVLHIGDWSGTLVGPWIEAAYCRSVLGDRAVIVRPGAAPASAEADSPEPELLIVSAHGYYAGSGAYGRLAFGSTEAGVHEMARRSFARPRCALLASCEVGMGHSELDELNGVSIPAVLLHIGVEQVLSPVTAVHDLVSCVLVTRTLAAMAGSASAPEAMATAIAELRDWRAADLDDWWAELFEHYSRSEIAEQAPWPLRHLRRHVLVRINAVKDDIPRLLTPYVLTAW